MDEELKTLEPYGTPMQRASVEALLEHGSIAAAAEALGITAPRLRAHLSELRTRAARRGWAPEADMTKPTPEGFTVKGTSTYYKVDPETGEKKAVGQWVKTRKDDEDRIALLMEAVQEMAEPFRGALDPVPAPKALDDDLLCAYPMGDPHLGMYAWAAETGDSFDLDIAERTLVGAVDALVEAAPAARHAVVINLGDFFHADNSANQTARSHHALDVDTRWGKVLSTGIRTMRRCIDRALVKHEDVKVICEIGNHDDHSAIMLALCLAGMYEREPRVQVDVSPAKFHWIEFGKVLLGVTHGDTVKADKLPGIMACDQAAAWGRTIYRHWYTGHVHHDSLKEYPGVTIGTYRTMAARDAWHAAAGYRSWRDMKCDVWHREWGPSGQHVVDIRQVWHRLRAGERSEA